MAANDNDKPLTPENPRPSPPKQGYRHDPQPHTTTKPNTALTRKHKDAPPTAETLTTPTGSHRPYTSSRQVSPIDNNSCRKDSPPRETVDILRNHTNMPQHHPDQRTPVHPRRARLALEAFGLTGKNRNHYRPPNTHTWHNAPGTPIAHICRKQDLQLICAVDGPGTVTTWIHRREPTLSARAVQERFKHKQPILTCIFSFLRPVPLVPHGLKHAIAHAGARASPSGPTWIHRTDGVRIHFTPYPTEPANAEDDWHTPTLWLYQINVVIPGCYCPALRGFNYVTVFQFGRGSVITAKAWLSPDETLRLCSDSSPLRFLYPAQFGARPPANLMPQTNNPTIPRNRLSHLPTLASSSLIHTIEHEVRAFQSARYPYDMQQ